MPVPKFNELMLPLLKLVDDGEEHTTQEIMSYLADFFGLSEEERNQLMPNQNRNLLYDRMNWAKVYLRKAKLIDSVSRSSIIITERGEMVVADDSLKEITKNYLLQFPEFSKFAKGDIIEPVNVSDHAGEIDLFFSPEEEIDKNYGRIFNALSDDLLEKIMNCSPSFFEKLVVELLVKMGYGGSIKDAGKVIGKTGDGGVDGVIKEDRLGLDLIYVQAKRWESTIGSKEVQAFVGALAWKMVKKGVFITTSTYSKAALEFVKSIDFKVILIDGRQLADLMIEYNLGVSSRKVYDIKQIDQDYFEI